MVAKKPSPQPEGMPSGDPRRPLKISRLREARASIAIMLARRPELDDPDYEEWANSVRTLLTELFGASGYLIRFRQLSIRPISYQLGGRRWWHADADQAWQTGLKQADKILGEAIEEAELITPPARVDAAPTQPHANRKHSNQAFIVHGHDDAAKESVARFLEKLGIEAVILHEQATSGRTIIEKLEHYSQVDFAVVLLTPDDVGGARDQAQQSRARQNVVLELGYFIGKLTRAHVCALYKGTLELPSDYLGVGYVSLDDGGGWQVALAKELRAAGFVVDMNQML